jgi:hypothetical protein
VVPQVLLSVQKLIHVGSDAGLQPDMDFSEQLSQRAELDFHARAEALGLDVTAATFQELGLVGGWSR